MNPENYNRRSFLKQLSIALGAGAFVSTSAFLSSCNSPNNNQLQANSGDTTVKPVFNPEQLSLDVETLQKRGRQGIPGRKWVMVIDLSKCRNARMCMAACQEAHHLKTEQHHINVLRMQDDENTQPYFMPKPCYHCDNPPCTKVCPVDATYKRADGIVLIDNARCIGCRSCVAGCPYSARVFHWLEPKQVAGDEKLNYDVELNVPQKRGTITKCLFSADRLRRGELPYCVSACPNGTYYFGDLNEDSVTNGTTKQTVRFSELIRENGGYTMLPELGTKPRVYHLPAKNRLFPFQFEGKTTI